MGQDCPKCTFVHDALYNNNNKYIIIYYINYMVVHIVNQHRSLHHIELQQHCDHCSSIVTTAAAL